MAATLDDLMQAYYATYLGKQGNLMDLEAEFFGFYATPAKTYNDGMLAAYYAANLKNGQSGATKGDLDFEKAKYYNFLSSLTPMQAFSVNDHMYDVFSKSGGPPGPNLMTTNQADVETDTSGWTPTACTVNITAVQHTGASGMRINTITTSGPCSVATPSGLSGFPVVGSKVYTASAWIRAASLARQAHVDIIWYDVSGVLISTTAGVQTLETVGAFTKYFNTATSPSNAKFAAVVIQLEGLVGVSEFHNTDTFSFNAGTSTGWMLP